MISLHYTSHTKAYNTIYTACNIVEAIYSFTMALSTLHLQTRTRWATLGEKKLATWRAQRSESGSRMFALSTVVISVLAREKLLYARYKPTL